MIKALVNLIVVVAVFTLMWFISPIFFGIDYTQSQYGYLVRFVVSVLGVLALGVLVVVYRMVRDYIRKVPGSKTRLRLGIDFLIVAFVPAVIFSLFSILLAETVNSYIYQEEDIQRSMVIDSLRDIKSYYDLKIKTMKKELKKYGFTVWVSRDPHRRFVARFKGSEAFFVMGNRKIFDLFLKWFESRKSKKIALTDTVVDVSGKTFLVFIYGNYIVAFKPESVFENISKRLMKILNIIENRALMHSSLSYGIIIFVLLLNIPSLLAAFFMSYVLSREITEVVKGLMEGYREISDGNFEVRVKVRARGGELADLVNGFNDMVERLKVAYKKLVQMEKMAVWQEVARRLAHEIKNPLTPIKLSAERLMMKAISGDIDADSIKKNAGIIVSEVDRVTKLVNEFSKFARLPKMRKEIVSLKSLIEEVSEMFSSADCKIELNLPHREVLIKADRDQLKQVFINLLKNAIEASPKGSVVEVSLMVMRRKTGRRAVVRIRDYGEGIPDDIKDKIFSPYFTTKKEGTGLGLAVSSRIVAEHGGDLYFHSKPLAGTEFFVELPLEVGNGKETQ